MLLRTITPIARYRTDTFDALHSALRNFDNMFTGLTHAAQTADNGMTLRLDIREDEQAYHIATDLPGLTDKDVEVTFDDGTLSIKGEKKVERDEKKDKWHFTERSHGSFARKLSLPAGIAADQIQAKFDKGVLTVTLPKLPAEQNGAKKITIQAG